MTIKRHLVGDTIQVTWVNSGVTPTDIYCTVYNEGETSVDSATMVSSGGGFYYHNHTISNTPGLYVAEIVATIDGNPYKRRVKFNAQKEEV